MLIINLPALLILLWIARIGGNLSFSFAERSSNVVHSDQQNMYRGYDNTIPAAPVQGQASSCTLDLSNELLGGVKAACMQGPLDRKHCCPVLAAWLMAARAKVALHPPFEQEPGMPVLPDDSLVCIASLKAALAERGIFISAPVADPTGNGSSSCDVVSCFCGIHLSQITLQSCPLPFSLKDDASNSTTNSSSLSTTQPTLPHFIQHYSDRSLHMLASSGLRASAIKYDKDVPLQPSVNNTSINLPTSSSPPPVASLHAPGLSGLLQQLAANCTDHSYRGCTRCLKTLTKEMKSGAAKAIIGGSKEKAKECEMIGLMWLLELNKTLYIPTVSAVVRALLFNDDNRSSTYQCSADTDNMPLALDYSELISTSSSPHPLTNPPLIPSCIFFLLVYFLFTPSWLGF